VGAASAPAWWSRPAQDVLASLGTRGSGLSTRSARKRLGEVGPNSESDRSEAAPLRLLLRQFESPLVLILIFGALAIVLLYLAATEAAKRWLYRHPPLPAKPGKGSRAAAPGSPA
jgi:hypothetical protein